jgi:hypothetical protein
MDTQLALMVNGPSKWYENLSQKFKTHAKTWLQQNKSLNSNYSAIFNETIRQQGYFLIFAYVQKPTQKVNYLLHIDQIISQYPERISPPDNTAPDFDTYDVEQGKCKNEGDYKYVTWLRVVHFEKIAPLSPQQFIRYNRGIALDHRYMKALHFYVVIPDQFQQLPRQQQLVISDLESLREEEEFFEGRRHERFSNYYEREPQLRSRSIEIHGTTCKACAFDFERKYGRRGKGFIEVHHLRPVSELKGETKIDPAADMTVVCPNCHRMIHRDKNKILSLEELKALIQD